MGLYAIQVPRLRLRPIHSSKRKDKQTYATILDKQLM